MQESGPQAGAGLKPDHSARPACGVPDFVGAPRQQYREIRHRNPPPPTDGSAGSRGTLHPWPEGLLRHAAQAQPIISENLCGLARLVRANSIAAMENITLW